MPNVNYRGKPSQDPNAPPESGMTSIPLGAPWPPLSREQVVQLHDALTVFRRVCRDAKDPRYAALELCDSLDSLGIGAPPPKTSSYCAPIFEWADRMKAEDRRERWEGDPPWTETMLRRVIYALRGFMCGWDKDARLNVKETAASEGLALLTLLREAGIESLLPKHMSLIGIPADELPSWPKDWVEESRRIDQKIAQAARLLAEAGLLTMPPPTRTWTHEEVAKVAEEVQQDRFSHITDLSRHSKPREEPTTDEDSGPGAMSWQRAEEFGSPFATQQPVETAKRECWTCGSFHINNGCGKKGTASAALAAHLKKMDDMIDGGASTTEVASMDLNCPGWEPKP